MVKSCRAQEWATEDAAQHALNLANWRIKLLQAKLEQVTSPYPPNPKLRLRAPIPRTMTLSSKPWIINHTTHTL